MPLNQETDKGPTAGRKAPGWAAWLDGTVTFHELKALVSRGGGVAFSSVGGFFALKAFLRFSPTDAAVLVALIGYLVFLPLAQFGFGRPCYGEVRERFIDGRLRPALVHSFLGLFGLQAAGATLAFAVFAGILAWGQSYQGSLAGILAFGLGQAALASGTYQRDLAYALSLDPHYEKWEFFRRVFSLLTFILILKGLPLWAGGLLTLVVAAISQARVARKLARVQAGPASSGEPDSGWRDLQPRIGSNSRWYLVFSVNEVVFYNLPLIVYSLSSFRQGIIYFGIWMKLFMLIVLPMRMLVDARVNRQTGHYFKGDAQAAWSSVLQSLKLALCTVLAGILVVWLIQPKFIRWLGAGGITEGPWFLLSLVAWGAGNAIQHVFGTFTVSYGNGVRFANKASFLSLLSVGGAFAALHLEGASPGAALFAGGLTYILTSVVYVHHVASLLRPAGGGGRGSQ